MSLELFCFLGGKSFKWETIKQHCIYLLCGKILVLIVLASEMGKLFKQVPLYFNLEMGSILWLLKHSHCIEISQNAKHCSSQIIQLYFSMWPEESLFTEEGQFLLPESYMEVRYCEFMTWNYVAILFCWSCYWIIVIFILLF